MARREQRLDQMADALRRENDANVVVAVGDVTDEEDVARSVDVAVAAFGQLDALVNNAGLMHLGRFGDVAAEQWRRVIDVNVRGAITCARLAWPHLARSAHGHLVNVGSVGGRRANAGSAVYNASKFAMAGLSEALRQEGVEEGIRVTLVEPGVTRTELGSQHEDPAVIEQIERVRSSVGEQLESADIARAIVFAMEQPAHVTVNELVVRPAGQRG